MERKIQERIREYRKERGLTLRQLAERAGCTPSYISQLEKGLTVPSLSMVGKLAAALNTTVSDLFSELSNGENGKDDCGESLHLLIRQGTNLIDDESQFEKELSRYFTFIHPKACHRILTDGIKDKY